MRIRKDYLWCDTHLHIGTKILLFPIYFGVLFCRYWNINWDIEMKYVPKKWVTEVIDRANSK